MALVTAEELLRLPDGHDVVELIDGEIRRFPLNSFEHGCIASLVGASLGRYSEATRVGVAVVATGFILRRDPDTVRAPDIGFVRKERWIDTIEYVPGPPDLAIEVIDADRDVNAKVVEWLQAGTQIVIVIDPAKRSAVIHRSLTKADQIAIDGSLDGGTVVPGWELPLRDLFVA